MNTTQHTGAEEWAHPLFISIQNNSLSADLIRHHVKQIAQVVSREAVRLAAERAEWHDDPQGDPEGWQKHHAPAKDQFPAKLQQAVAVELVEYYITETLGL